MANYKKGVKTSPKKGKSKKAFTKGKEDFEDKTTNDPSWYALSGQLLHDVATLPFSQKVGDVPIVYQPNGQRWNKHNASIPAFMEIKLVDTYGSPKNISDPINLAGAHNFAEIRKANSGSTNYSKANLMMYYMALGSAYSFYSYMTRIYGLVRAYNPYNKMVPRYLVTAMGVDFDNIQKNIANFRAGINLFANKLNYFSTPADLPFFRRKQMLYANVYADEDSVKAQLYFFQPEYFHVYAEPGTTDPSKVGKLVPHKLIGTNPDGFVTVDDILSMADEMILPIIHSQDFDIIAGDIRKTYSNLTVVSPITEDYLVMPVYDSMMLEQIHNLNTLGSDLYTGSTMDDIKLDDDFGTIEEDMSQTANAGALICHTGYTRPMPDFTYNQLFDLKISNPSPEDVVEATRFKYFATCQRQDLPDGTGWHCEVVTSGLEIPLWFRFHWIDTDELSKAPYYGLQFYKCWTNTGNRPLNMGKLLAFERAPIVYYTTKATDDNMPMVYGYATEVDNWTILHAETLKRMNEAAMLALFTSAK